MKGSAKIQTGSLAAPSVRSNVILRVARINGINGHCRTGIRIRGGKANREVRSSIMKFAKWLRKKYSFPLRVTVYLSLRKTIIGNGKTCSASIFLPFERSVEPYIRISTGDYLEVKKTLGRNNALAGILNSLAHEVVHYHQWWESRETSERQAVRKAESMIVSYSRTTSRP